jgi:hypothetical protein
MSEPHTQPETWAEAASEWGEQFFAIRVTQCSSLNHLRAAVKYEAEHKARTDRIKRLNKQIERQK